MSTTTETPVRFTWMATGRYLGIGGSSSVSNSTMEPVTRDEALAIAIDRFEDTWGFTPSLVEVAPLDHPEQATYHQHEHVWGVVERAWITGNPHRKCRCGFVSLDLSDEDEEEEDDG